MWFDKGILSIVSSTFSLSIFVTNFKVDLLVLKQSCVLPVSVFALRSTTLNEAFVDLIFSPLATKVTKFCTTKH